MRLTILLGGVLTVGLFLLGCGRANTSPTPTLTPTIPLAPPLITTTVSTPTLPPTPTSSPTPTQSYTPIPTTSDSPLYLPIVGTQGEDTTTPTATPRPTDTPTPTATPTLDFAAIRTHLQSQGQELAFVKIGFHTGLSNHHEGLDEWMHRLDSAGVPIFLKSVGNAEPLFYAQEMMKQSGVPHVLVYRRSGDEYDLPRYDLPPAEAARLHWQLHVEAFPPELDPNLVWLETINEPDKGRAEWLAEFALATAELALADGYKWAAFGWSSGEPEMTDWQSPAMLRFLALAGQHPDRLAIALHEYSYTTEDIQHEFPYKVGRFRFLFEAADTHGLPRPTVLITEWGWAYQDVPEPPQALADVAWAAELYAPYPEIKGVAIWYLGMGYGDIDQQVQRLIAPLTEYALGHYFAVE